MSFASKCTSTSDPMGDSCSDHSSLVTPPRFCDAENSSPRPMVSWANLRASSSLPGRTGNAPMNVAMSIPLFLVVCAEPTTVQDSLPAGHAAVRVDERTFGAPSSEQFDGRETQTDEGAPKVLSST